MKQIIYIFIITLTLSFTIQQSEGKKFLDSKRGWKEFCVGKSTTDIKSSIKFLGRDAKGNYGFQSTTPPSLFETAPVNNIILTSKDSLTINSVTINLGVICSADFKSNTKFMDVTNKLKRIFGKVSSTDHNQSLGEYSFYWTGNTTVCGFATKWDANKRHYTGLIVFYPITSSNEERNNF